VQRHQWHESRADGRKAAAKPDPAVERALRRFAVNQTMPIQP
jgi:hypothetical protein